MEILLLIFLSWLIPICFVLSDIGETLKKILKAIKTQNNDN